MLLGEFEGCEGAFFGAGADAGGFGGVGGMGMGWWWWVRLVRVWLVCEM